MIERQIHLSSGGGAALQGYDGLLRFGYTKNRGIYALRVEADGEWQGMTLRAFWHLPDGNAAPSKLAAAAFRDTFSSSSHWPGSLGSPFGPWGPGSPLGRKG